MRILLLDSEDSPLTGPWSRQHWDCIVDLGNSSLFSENFWTGACDSKIIRTERFRRGVEDALEADTIFSRGRGRLVDEEGIDWWDLTSLVLAPELLLLLALRRAADDISPAAELWSTRRGGSLRLLEVLLNRRIKSFGDDVPKRWTKRLMHYAGLVRDLPAAQFKEIFFDKYDAGHRWRGRFARRHETCADPVVLLPSAYGNVSRMASAYARIIPEQRFLLVATRSSGKQFTPPPNVEIRDLTSYANSAPADGSHETLASVESRPLIELWRGLRTEFQDIPELRLLTEAGVLDCIPGWIQSGLGARNAWRNVLQREPVQAVLCGDDSNIFTRLPMLLASRRRIPTIDFHHGALDGRYLLKDMHCDTYLVKNEMERDYMVRVCGLPADRMILGAPPAMAAVAKISAAAGKQSAIVFSEPYEVAEMRAAEVYREILPSLCRVARANDRGVILKLHPFEKIAKRKKILEEVLTPEDAQMITVLDGPLTPELLARAWFGVTVESTTVIECLQHGVCCFVCGWLSLSPYGYMQQYARYGVGEMLADAQQLDDVPRRLAEFHRRKTIPLESPVITAETLKTLFVSPERVAARAAL